MWSRLIRTVAPAERPVILAEARRHLRVDHGEDDQLIESLIDAATAEIDGAHGIGCALVTQTWSMSLDRFEDPIELPIYPVIAISSITYTDLDGNSQTVAAENYELHKYATSALVCAVQAVSWPGTLAGRNRVTVTFTAGFGATAASVPADLKQAILMSVAHWYEHREAVVVGTSAMIMPQAAASILKRYRVGTIA